jgi:hypothetical protein
VVAPMYRAVMRGISELTCENYHSQPPHRRVRASMQGSPHRQLQVQMRAQRAESVSIGLPGTSLLGRVR